MMSAMRCYRAPQPFFRATFSCAKSNRFPPPCQTRAISPRRLVVLAIVAVMLVGIAAPAFSEDTALSRGEDYYLENDPERALHWLEQALEQEPENPEVYLYLGVVYEQLGLFERAIEIMEDGLEVSGADRGTLYYNMANNYQRLGRREEAMDHYTKALEYDERFAEAYLNRANLRVRASDYPEAIEDYSTYLEHDPDSRQRGEVERMIALLRDTIEQEEQERLRRAEEERQARLEEERRAAEEERRRQEAEERRRVLLETVRDSLGTSRDEGRTFSAPSEDIEEYDDELDIID